MRESLQDYSKVAVSHWLSVPCNDLRGGGGGGGRAAVQCEGAAFVRSLAHTHTRTAKEEREK